jgi:hypothetical protein
MCVILSSSPEPTKTHLINIPGVLFSPEDKNPDCAAQISLYNNDIGVSVENPFCMVVAYPMYDYAMIKSGGVAGTEVGREKVKARIGLIDMDNAGTLPEHAKNIQYQGTRLGDEKFRIPLVSLGVSFGLSADGDDHTRSLKVHRVGNYNVSLAFEYDDLLTRLDAGAFRRPADYADRIATFRDTNLFLGPMFYVVSQCVDPSITTGSFGVVYPAPFDVQYFPTCHQGSYGRNVHYDVRCTFLLPLEESGASLVNPKSSLFLRFQSGYDYGKPRPQVVAVEGYNAYFSERPDEIDFATMPYTQTNTVTRIPIVGSDFVFSADLVRFSVLCTTLISTNAPNQNIHTRIQLQN